MSCKAWVFLSLKWHWECGISGISIPGDNQEVSGHGSVQLALGGPCMSREVAPGDFRGPFQPQPASDLVQLVGKLFYILQEFKTFYVGMNSDSSSFVPEMQVREKLSFPPPVFSWRLQSRMLCPCCASYRAKKFFHPRRNVLGIGLQPELFVSAGITKGFCWFMP